MQARVGPGKWSVPEAFSFLDRPCNSKNFRKYEYPPPKMVSGCKRFMDLRSEVRMRSVHACAHVPSPPPPHTHTRAVVMLVLGAERQTVHARVRVLVRVHAYRTRALRVCVRAYTVWVGRTWRARWRRQGAPARP